MQPRQHRAALVGAAFAVAGALCLGVLAGATPPTPGQTQTPSAELVFVDPTGSVEHVKRRLQAGFLIAQLHIPGARAMGRVAARRRRPGSRRGARAAWSRPAGRPRRTGRHARGPARRPGARAARRDRVPSGDVADRVAGRLLAHQRRPADARRPGRLERPRRRLRVPSRRCSPARSTRPAPRPRALRETPRSAST